MSFLIKGIGWFEKIMKIFSSSFMVLTLLISQEICYFLSHQLCVYYWKIEQQKQIVSESIVVFSLCLSEFLRFRIIIIYWFIQSGVLILIVIIPIFWVLNPLSGIFISPFENLKPNIFFKPWKPVVFILLSNVDDILYLLILSCDSTCKFLYES